MVSSNWYTRYLDELPYDREMYDVNKKRFISCMLRFGYKPCEIFTCGYEHNLVERIMFQRDARIARNVSLIVETYPCYMDWFSASKEWDCSITKEDFDEGIVLEEEPFLRTYSMWESTLKNMTRYVMQHEAIYGKKKMWDNPLYY